jgi:hypothetical protein
MQRQNKRARRARWAKLPGLGLTIEKMPLAGGRSYSVCPMHGAV